MIGLAGLPAGSLLLTMLWSPGIIIGLSGGMLSGVSNGKVGMIGRMAKYVSSNGLTRTVSFQPSSAGSGAMMLLSHVTRFSSCTSYRWKWIGCVSTPLCVNFQICVPSDATAMGFRFCVVGRLAPLKISVAGFTNGYRMTFWV